MPTNDLLTRAVAKVIPQKLAEKKLRSRKKLRVYWGIDPTGSKLHLGHAVPLRKLQAFANAGHEVILVIGSFTAMIGDPSGRDEMRQPLTKEQVEENFRTYKEQATKVLDFTKVAVRYNYEWLKKLQFADIVKIASNFTVQQMLQREIFKTRASAKVHCPECRQINLLVRSFDIPPQEMSGRMFGGKDGIIFHKWKCGKCKKDFDVHLKGVIQPSPIFIHEFLYPLMVGYDSVVLDVDGEIGGTDQEFNMLCGRDLQNIFGKREKFVLTLKLLEGTDGRKMSKTYKNCISLEDPPNEMFGKVMSIRDDLMATYFECCTDVPMDEVRIILSSSKDGTNLRAAKTRLAHEIVTLYHGAKAADRADKEFTRVFSKGETPQDIPAFRVEKGTPLIDALVTSGLVSSKSEARRLIEQKGIELNKKVVQNVAAKAEKGIVQVGKRRFLRLTITAP